MVLGMSLGVHVSTAFTPADISFVSTSSHEITVHKGGNGYSLNIGGYNYSISDYQTKGDYLVLLTQSNAAREDYQLQIFKGGQLVAKIPSVSKEFLITEEQLYYVAAAANYHHYDTLYCCSLSNPGNRTVYYRRQDPSHTLRLARGVDDGEPYLVLTTYDPEKTVIRSLGTLELVFDKYHISNDCPWLLSTPPDDKLFWADPKWHIYVNGGYSILKTAGGPPNKVLVGGNPSKHTSLEGYQILKVLGWIDPVIGDNPGKFMIRPVKGVPYLLDASTGKTIIANLSRPLPEYNAVLEEYPQCPIITVTPGSAEGLKPASALPTLIVFFGADGLRTRTRAPYQYWGPLLKRVWRVIYVLAPGGGDNGAAWKELGRRSYHRATIEVIACAIQWIMGVYQCQWERTAIYSRSAGGIPAGVLTLRGLTGISWMEHPFVDVLATMSNPALPLTAVEYDEFGWSRRGDRVEDISPMNIPARVDLRRRGEQRVLIRGGCEDTQVYCYELLKFAGRLRRELGEGVEVLCAMEAGEGHFYSGRAWMEARAADLALLDYWAGGVKKISGRGIKEMVKTHRNKDSRKNKNKSKNSRRNKNMEGGKRKTRRSKATRRRRVVRKH